MNIKICGINNFTILQHTCDLDVDYVGLILTDRSPRKITQEFLSSLKTFNFKDVTPVCVFVNPSPELVERAINILPQAILQFHGDESDEFCKQFQQPFWKSIPMRDDSSLQVIDSFPSAQALLLEAYSKELYGGSGKAFNWDMLKTLDLSSRFVIAGGIDSKNINKAISLDPWCIDINSGVESKPAIKEQALITEIVEMFKYE